MKSPEPSESDAPGERRISLPALRCFVAVVEGGSLSRAAERLGLSQPTVSVALAGLERACGTLLLHRRPRLILTDAGRDLLVRARLVLGRMQELESSVAAFSALRRGSLTIGISSPAFAMPMIAALLRDHSGIDVRTRLGNTAALIAALTACEIEVAVMTMIHPPESLTCTKIAEQRLVACLPRGPSQRRITLAKLAQGPLILREPGSMTRAMLEAALLAQGLTAKVVLEVGSREAAREAVAAGIGVGVVLDGEVGEDARLVAVPIAGPPILGGVYAVVLPESLDLPAVRAFLGKAG